MTAEILIVGGGIGGLTAALCCERYGMHVHLFEQSPAFGDVGAGIQLSPNCTRVLHDLGLEDALRAIGFLPEGTEMRDWKTGRLLTSRELGTPLVDRYGYPYYHVHRADLIEVLVTAARRRPHIELHAGSRVDEIGRSEANVSIRAGDVRYEGNLLIGADGIHSSVRAALFGREAPTFTGNVAWRGLVPTDRLPRGLIRPMATVWWGPHKHFVHYFVRGGALVNCVCVIEKTGWETESWTEHGEHTELVADFAGWHPTVGALIDNMDHDACFKWALFDRPPMARWSDGLATLLGDACHPTLPFMAQGAAMAIEDAAILARCVADGGATPGSLARYEALRRARTSQIQAGSRRNAKLFHMSGIAAWLRNRALRTAGGPTLDWVYGYDPNAAAGDSS